MAKRYYVAGKNQYYDLGLGDATQRNAHTLLASEWLVIRSSTAYLKFSVGIKADGTMWGVGDNSIKQLGLAAASYTEWTQIGTDTDWADIALGDYHTLAIKAGGTLWACGQNISGQCGTGNYTSPVSALTQVGTDTDWAQLASNYRCSFAVKSSGALWAWGENGAGGMLGLGVTTGAFNTPQSVTLAAGIASLAIGSGYGLAVLSTGTLWAWGGNGNGQLGLNDTATRLSPTQVGVATDWAIVAAVYGTSYAIKTTGTAWTCGDSQDYATVQGSLTDLDEFTQIGSATDWVGVSAGYNNVMLRNSAGAVFVCGRNLNGTLGTGAATSVTTLRDLEAYYGIVLPEGLESVAAYYDTSYFVVNAPPAYATAPMTLTVINPSGIASAPMTLTMIGSGVASAPMTLAMIEATDATRWSARCLIDGVDFSAQMVGQSSVTCEEGAARIASLTLQPASGAIDPLDYVGRAITLDYVRVIGGVDVPQRLFTGRIDTPEYNPTSTLLNLTCVDDLQNRVAALDRSVIDGLVGGRYTEAVQGAVDDNWDYAEARLTTVAASLDAGASGGMRVTPWEIDTVWATFGDGDLIYERPRLSLPQRSTLVNSVTIEFDYRYPRLRQRFTTVGWSGTQLDMAACGYQYPTQQDVLGAASGSGWTVTLGVFYPAPASIPHSSGGFIYPDDGAIDMAILHLAQRHSQTVTEQFRLLVTADESVAQNGTLPHALRGALQSSFDGNAWESALDVAPLLPDGGEMDYAPDAPRAAADYSINTLLDQARVKILASHRGARVGNAILCNPDLDLDKHVEIDTTWVQASGKVASVVHVLDFDSGSATSEFDIAIFGAGGAGIITPDTLAPPDPPAEAAETQDWPGEVPSLWVNTFGVTPYTENLMGLLLNPPETILVQDIPGVGSQSVPNPSYVAGSYPVTGFRVQMPGVDDGDRNPLDKPTSASYSIIVPADPMTFTVP